MVTDDGGFDRGTSIVFREVVPEAFGGLPDHPGLVYSAIVIADHPSAIVTFQPVGGPLMRRTGTRGGPRGRNIIRGGWDGGHRADVWRGDSVVRVHRAGEPWSTWRWTRDGAWLPGFYLNLEAPWRRTTNGFDSHDWELDLIVREAEEGLAVELKDQDEFEWCALEGGFPVEAVDRIRAAAVQARAVVEGGGWPLNANWDDWLPDPRWPIPALPRS